MDVPLTPAELLAAYKTKPFPTMIRVMQCVAVLLAGARAAEQRLGGTDLLAVAAWARAWGDLEVVACTTLPAAMAPPAWRDLRADVAQRLSTWLRYRTTQAALGAVADTMLDRRYLQAREWGQLSARHPTMPLIPMGMSTSHPAPGRPPVSRPQAPASVAATPKSAPRGVPRAVWWTPALITCLARLVGVGQTPSGA